MKNIIFSLLVLSVVSSCQTAVPKKEVSNAKQLEEAIEQAEPGDEIIMSNGVWKAIQIRFIAMGTEAKPITLRAQTPGQVILEGESDLKFGGKYLVVDGLKFQNGYSPSAAIIEFQTDNNNVASYCKVTNCVIDGFNKSQRNKRDLWVRFRGRHNELSHCYLAGKSNRGPTIRVDIEGNESINNHHKIINNHFGPRPPKGGPSAETIQIGNSSTSMSPSYTLVANNLFDRCNGEVEVISSKSNFNEFRNNVFYKSEGSLVTRHGNYCTVDGNYFIGDDDSEQIGGVRLIGTGHWVTNNYFYKLKGQAFRSPLAVMNGIPKSPLNRYIQVTDVVVAHNSWIDCKSPLQFGIGSNVEQKEVLPASEIRSARPVRTTVANNIIYNSVGDANPVVAHDKLDGINFQSNIISNQGVAFESIEGLESNSFSIAELEQDLVVPADNIDEVKVFSGFEFETITKDLFGVSRKDNNRVGAVTVNGGIKPDIYGKSNYGPKWYSNESINKTGETIAVSDVRDLRTKIDAAKDGSVIQLAPGDYNLTAPLKINKAITLSSASKGGARIIYAGPSDTPVFEMNPKGQLSLKSITLTGDGSQFVFASLKHDMSSLYNLNVEDCVISNFDYVLKAYKYSFAENIVFRSTSIRNCNNGLELSEEIEDKGEYNAENILIDNCQFSNVGQNVIDYYRGGYDESTVGGNLTVSNSTFENCGANEKNGILINTYGIINVNISNNTFKNNSAHQVALLWGAKNNKQSNNVFSNSGRIDTEENLKLKLLY